MSCRIGDRLMFLGESIFPSLEDFRDLCRGHTVVPVYREIVADLDTPVSAFLKLHEKGEGFLLESVEGGDRWGRYSILGTDPIMSLRAEDSGLRVVRRGWPDRHDEGRSHRCFGRRAGTV